MAKAFLKSRTYSNNFRPETSSFLIGNVGDLINLELQFDVEINYASAITSSIAEVVNNDVITRTSGSFLDDGFIQGGNVTIVSDHNTGVNTTTATIQTLSPNTMILTSLAGDVLENGIYPSIADSNGALTISSDTSIEGIELNYNLITNSDASTGGTDNSLIDGTIPTFKQGGLDATSPTEIDLTPFNYSSGSSVKSAKIKGLGIASGVQSFQIDIQFYITPFYDATTDLQGSTDPSFFDDVECVSDYIYAKFLPQPSNPNIYVDVDTSQTNLLGNTGYFNENFNGGADAFTIDSIKYKTSTYIPTLSILSGEATNFELIINHVGNTALSEYKLGWCWSPIDTTFYSNNSNTYQSNLMYCGAGDETPITEAGSFTTYTGTPRAFPATPSYNPRMDIKVDSLNRIGSQVVIKGSFNPNSDFNSFMQSLGSTDLNFAFWVSAADETLPTLSSNRVSKLVDFGEISFSSNGITQFDVTNSFLGHAQTSNQLGASVIQACSEDEISASGLIKIDTAKQETIESVFFSIEGYNITNNDIYILDINAYDTSAFVKDINGIQQINVDALRGFKMATGVEKNKVLVYRSPIDDVGTKIAYKYLFSFRARWEDWIFAFQVSPDFYDANQLNDGLNYDYATKDNLADWRLQFVVRMNVNRAGAIVQTRNAFDFNVFDYNESNVWDGIIKHYDDTKTFPLYIGLNADNLPESAISTNTNTWIEADFDLEDLLGDVGDINDYYGVIRIEEYRNGGQFAIDMLSTILDNETTQNILVPLTGESKCKITKISTTKIRLECYIDYTKLNTSVSNYKVSARIGKKDINVGKYSSHYSVKYN